MSNVQELSDNTPTERREKKIDWRL